MEVMGYEEREEKKVVARGKVRNVEGGTLHGVPIYTDCLSLEVQKSEDNDYVLFRSVDLDDLPIRKIEEAVGWFILWPTEFLHHACMLS